MTPRELTPGGWCAHAADCGGIDVPVYRGGGEAMLCERCEAERLAEVERRAAPAAA